MKESTLFVQDRLGKSAQWRQLNSDKNRKLFKRVERMSIMCIKVIIRNYSLIEDYQVDNLIQNLLFFSKSAPEISSVTSQ